MPRPYGWERFNRLSDPNNPYNLVDSASAAAPRRRPPSRRLVRAVCVRDAPAVPARTADAGRRARAAGAAARGLELALTPGDVADLDQIVALSQSYAPAVVSRYGADGERTALLELARSAGFEQRVHALLAAQGEAPPGPVVLFRAEARAAGAIHGNLTFVQGHVAFHPDPAKPEQLGVLDGALGELAAGQRVLGYAVLPAHLDPSAADRHLLGRPPHHGDAARRPRRINAPAGESRESRGERCGADRFRERREARARVRASASRRPRPPSGPSRTSVARRRNRSASSRCAASVAASFAAPRTGTSQSSAEAGIFSRCA